MTESESKKFFQEFDDNLVKGITPVEKQKKIIPDDNEEITFESNKLNVDVSEPMRVLLVQLRRTLLLNNLRSSTQLVKVMNQGFAEGMTKDTIRDLITDALKDIVGLGLRQIQRLLPVELKHMEFANRPKAVTMTASQEPDDPLIETLGECIKQLKTHPEAREQTICSLISILQKELEQ